MNKYAFAALAALIPLLFPFLALAAEPATNMHLGPHPAGFLCVAIFILSYMAVLSEEYTHLKKSKPVMLGAGLIWIVIAIVAPSYGVDHAGVRRAVLYGLEEYASLLLFLLAAMTYISALEDRNVFAVIRDKLIVAGFSLRQLFWATGLMAFFLSPIADNLTTALVMGAVVMAVGKHDPKFIALGCLNIVCAANAGGAFSPFGDITTLMVWQAEKLSFFEFFALFIPSVVNYLVPAVVMSFFVTTDKPDPIKSDVKLKRGARVIIVLGFCSIAMAVSFEQLLGLPPFLGMMIGMSLLMVVAHFIRHVGDRKDKDFDILDNVASAEWDTLLFFFGVIFSVGGLGYIGYLEAMSMTLYEGWGPGITNIALGFLSAIVDNIPIMFAVLTMNPPMDHFQWLLVTLTAGVGGSLLSIGSAAGVALMGVGHKHYTFFSHLKWFPVLLLGYAASVAAHYWLNSHLMGVGG